jgi:hypothetical protein
VREKHGSTVDKAQPNRGSHERGRSVAPLGYPWQHPNLWPTCRSFKQSVDDVWLSEHVWTRRAGLKEYINASWHLVLSNIHIHVLKKRYLGLI